MLWPNPCCPIFASGWNLPAPGTALAERRSSASLEAGAASASYCAVWSCNVRTLHPTLHVERTGRPLSADYGREQFRTTLQHRANDRYRHCDLTRRSHRTDADALGAVPLVVGKITQRTTVDL